MCFYWVVLNIIFKIFSPSPRRCKRCCNYLSKSSIKPLFFCSSYPYILLFSESPILLSSSCHHAKATRIQIHPSSLCLWSYYGLFLHLLAPHTTYSYNLQQSSTLDCRYIRCFHFHNNSCNTSQNASIRWHVSDSSRTYRCYYTFSTQGYDTITRTARKAMYFISRSTFY